MANQESPKTDDSRKTGLALRLFRSVWNPDYHRAARTNARELILTYLVIIAVMLLGCLHMGGILRQQMRYYSSSIAATLEARLETLIAANKEILAEFTGIVGRDLDKGASAAELRARLIKLTRDHFNPGNRSGAFMDLYGFIDGNYLDGMGWDPPPDFVPPSRSWHVGAMKNNGAPHLTEAYLDARTGQYIFSVARVVFDAAAAARGVLSLDFSVESLITAIQSLELPSLDFIILLDRSLRVISHPNRDFSGRPVREIPGFADFSWTEGPDASKITQYGDSNRVYLFNRLSNGWFLGMAIPRPDYYQDLYRMIPVMGSVGGLLMLCLSYLMVRLSAARMRSEEESRSKSTFLAHMSHEIRTPMNAIIGMSELAMRADNLPDVAAYVRDIHTAGRNLLSIINEILDISRIESGNLEISPLPYRLSHLLNDVLNVVRVRLLEKSILLIADIQPDLPRQLMGDEARIRQVLLNILTNAVKYTHDGYILLKMAGSAGREGEIILSCEVRDSGIGIKPEDMKRLFGHFVRLDGQKNRGVEGTGLGLAISRRLCRAMRGEIAAASVYGKGSSFTITIPQGIYQAEPLAAVEDPRDKRVLYYDERRLYAASVAASLQALRVPTTLARNGREFLDLLTGGGHSLAFVSPGLVNAAASLIRRNNLPTRLVRLANLGDITSHEDVQTLIMPVHTVSLANFLNGGRPTSADSLKDYSLRFLAPSVRVLVVDDNRTNLKVTQGFLLPHQMQVDLCESGDEAIALARKKSYDLIFMDHMMPGMDGLEAAAVIRNMEGYRDVPIIALTANAVSGMREMFLEKGMNDFLSKPIDPAMMDRLLCKWIPGAKRGDSARLRAETKKTVPPELDGVDLPAALKRFGGDSEFYRRVARSFLDETPGILNRLRHPTADNLDDCALAAHSLKGIGFNIGAEAIGKAAAEVEEAVRNRDLPALEAKNGILIPAVEALLASLTAFVGDGNRNSEGELRDSPDPETLAAVLEAAESYDAETLGKLLFELERNDYRDGGEMVGWLRREFDGLEYRHIRDRLRRELGQPQS
ncbi:MAG: response regulator [Planctomycetota bacterium]|jgi:signal transduction histidine kinase/HPt (histidine-containing phosphotransfer) domain-containing protein/AmiR/NasT family two-component response regulator|nr:response regulator [Planctomycetota bacterium]